MLVFYDDGDEVCNALVLSRCSVLYPLQGDGKGHGALDKTSRYDGGEVGRLCIIMMKRSSDI